MAFDATIEQYNKIKKKARKYDRIRNGILAHINLNDYIISEYVKFPINKKSKQESDRYWNAISENKTLTDILEFGNGL